MAHIKSVNIPVSVAPLIRIFQPFFLKIANRFYSKPIDISEVGTLYSGLRRESEFKRIMFTENWRLVLKNEEEFLQGFRSIFEILKKRD